MGRIVIEVKWGVDEIVDGWHIQLADEGVDGEDCDLIGVDGISSWQMRGWMGRIVIYLGWMAYPAGR